MARKIVEKHGGFLPHPIVTGRNYCGARVERIERENERKGRKSERQCVA
jgi:hypothetical protein